MRLVEMVIDENADASGISAISIVEEPAIESDFITLSKHEIKLAEVDKERRVLMGAALIPDKPILRVDDNNEPYNIFFSQDTVRKASELFLKESKQNEGTLEHDEDIEGVSVVESWIVDDPENDKSNAYNLSLPKGTWAVSMKVYNDEIWREYVKTGKVKGFSIEGMFMGKLSKQAISETQLIDALIKRFNGLK